MKFSGEKVVEIYEKIQQKRPIIHCITNAVTVNDCANILLAAGASPTMAHHPCEVEEITAGTAALICNFGAISDYEAMETAGKRAHALGHPIVIDPVGVSGASYRREKCLELMKIIHPTCIRGNYSEIQALLHNCGTVTGVDAAEDALAEAEETDLPELMKQYAKENQMILVASGETDLITDGSCVYRCHNGSRDAWCFFKCGKFGGECSGMLCVYWHCRRTCGERNDRAKERDDDVSQLVY